MKLGKLFLKTAMENLLLATREYDQIQEISRTFADLACTEGIKIEHLAEANQY